MARYVFCFFPKQRLRLRVLYNSSTRQVSASPDPKSVARDCRLPDCRLPEYRLPECRLPEFRLPESLQTLLFRVLRRQGVLRCSLLSSVVALTCEVHGRKARDCESHAVAVVVVAGVVALIPKRVTFGVYGCGQVATLIVVLIGLCLPPLRVISGVLSPKV